MSAFRPERRRRTWRRAHRLDLQIPRRHGVRYLRYWIDEEAGKVFCLSEAPKRASGRDDPPRSPRRAPRRQDLRGERSRVTRGEDVVASEEEEAVMAEPFIFIGTTPSRKACSRTTRSSSKSSARPSSRRTSRA
ncbi:MAG: nickel-binding protein [Actinomycetota bacterium]